MTTVGFVGLGLIGKPMCLNIAKKGFELTCWNRTASKMDDVVAAGAVGATSPMQAAEGKDVTVVCVNDSTDMEAVILGPNGIIEGAKPGSIVVDMSTVSPSATKRVAAALAEKGIDMLDAPVSGGVVGAENAALSIMVGGEADVLERARPVLEAMGTRITLCGPNGMGQVTKLANNITGQATLAAVAEGLIFAAKSGADPNAVLSALGGGAAQSWMLDNLGPKMYDRNFAPGFMVDTAQKDMRLILETAEETNVPLPVTAVMIQIFRSAQEMGYGREGTQAYIKVIEKLAGIELSR